MKRLLCGLALLAAPAHAQNVTILNPPGAITATGPCGLAAQAGNTL